MRVTTELILAIETGEVLSRKSYDYDGPVCLCKGELQQAEQQAAAVSQQELALMQQQLGLQQQALAPVQQTEQGIISAGGMTPQQQSAETSIAMNTLPATYQNLIGQINQQLVARGVTGGNNAGGGAIAQGFGAVGAQEAGQQANLLSQIQLQKQQQLQQALSGQMGVAASYGQNTGTFNQGGLNALNTQTTAANDIAQNSTGFFGSLIGALTAPFKISASLGASGGGG